VLLVSSGLLCALGLLAAVSGVLAARDASATAIATDRGFPGGRYFVVNCPFSHRNNDDPIVFPGEPGRSHDHTYLGNTSVDARSTPASLRGGETTCNVKSDAAGYWLPTLYAGQSPIVPFLALAYYVRRTSGYLRPFPADLRMVAGEATAKRAQSRTVVSWSCGGIGGARRFAVPPRCSRNQPLRYIVEFPNCWNGKSADSPNHKSHMAYSRRGRCPASHPVEVPKLVLVVFYEGVPAGAQLSSGKFGGHADFMNGWDPNVLAAYVQQI
jgi:hypothetical protein